MFLIELDSSCFGHTFALLPLVWSLTQAGFKHSDIWTFSLFAKVAFFCPGFFSSQIKISSEAQAYNTHKSIQKNTIPFLFSAKMHNLNFSSTLTLTLRMIHVFSFLYRYKQQIIMKDHCHLTDLVIMLHVRSFYDHCSPTCIIRDL